MFVLHPPGWGWPHLRDTPAFPRVPLAVLGIQQPSLPVLLWDHFIMFDLISLAFTPDFPQDL